MSVFTQTHQVDRHIWYFTEFKNKNSARLHTIMSELWFSCHSRKVLIWTKLLRLMEGMHVFNNLFIYEQVLVPESFGLEKSGQPFRRHLLSCHIDRCFSQATSERFGTVWPVEEVLFRKRWDIVSASNGNVWNKFISFLLLLKQICVWLKMIGPNVMLELSSPTTKSSKSLLNFTTIFGRGHVKILPGSAFHLRLAFQFMWPSTISKFV